MDISKEREAFENWHIRNMDINSDFEKISEQDSPYMDEHVNNSWLTWQAAKSQAVPEKDAVIKKLSDQLYEQEMKTSAARVLCETACELLDDYAHQDAMVILNDLEQAMSTGASK